MTTHHADVSQLLTVLTREAELLATLKDLIDREREAIRTLSHRDFHSINLNRQTVLRDLAQVEEERAHCVIGLATHRGIPPETVTVQHLLEWAGPERAHDLQGVRDRLSSVLQDIREGFHANRALITKFLGFLQDGLSAWRHSSAIPSGYSALGALNPIVDGSQLFEKRG